MHRARSFAALGVSVVVAVVEILTGFRAESVGLVADAVHAATDALAIGVMLLAAHRRLDVIGAVVNSVLLLAVTGFIAYGAVQRLSHPAHPQGGVMAAVAAFALVGNIVAGVLLLPKATHSINLRGAFLNVAGDAAGSFAVLVAGLLIARTHRAWIDPAFSLFVCAAVLGAVAHLLRAAFRSSEKAPA